MQEEGHGQNLKATLSQQSAALQKLQIKIAQLEKRNQAQGQRPRQGKTRFGDVPGAGHAIVHCLDQKSDILEAMKMSKSVGPNTLIRSKEKQEHATMQVKAKVSPILDDIVHKSSTTCLMHFSLSKSVITGLMEPRYIEEETPGTSLPTDQKEAQSTKQLKLLNTPKPVIKVSNQGKCLTTPLDTGLNICILGTSIPDGSHMLTEVPRAEPVHEFNQNPHHKWKPKSEQCIVQVPKSEKSEIGTKKQGEYKANKEQEVLTAAFDIKNVENFLGCKEESFKEIPPDNLLLLGGSTPKMVRTEPTRIYPVSRSEKFQRGGYDAAIKSVVEPEINQALQTGHFGDTSDRGSVQSEYLNNQKDHNLHSIHITHPIIDLVDPSSLHLPSCPLCSPACNRSA
ncbi:hypothetical protein DY000_02030379 [Brassica cretica]|uniref:Uncharacterized protein n=1 Tax=Brassica cretica TaxID=69181 RepID=A0ABQ7DKN9_BRACR|nr:hypothetical protein DY000_02030379 [Brassica cretica]